MWVDNQLKLCCLPAFIKIMKKMMLTSITQMHCHPDDGSTEAELGLKPAVTALETGPDGSEAGWIMLGCNGTDGFPPLRSTSQFRFNPVFLLARSHYSF